MKLSPEKQKHLAIAVLSVVAAAFCLWYFGVQGIRAKQVRDTRELEQLKSEGLKQTQAIAREKTNREEAKAYLAFIDQYEAAMPKGNTETWLVRELSELASRYKFQLSNTIIQPIPELSELKFKGQPYKLEGFRFEFKGELNQIGKFLEEIENNIPLMEIDELSITAGSDIAPHVHSVSIRISMVTKS